MSDLHLIQALEEIRDFNVEAPSNNPSEVMALAARVIISMRKIASDALSKVTWPTPEDYGEINESKRMNE